MHTCIYMSKTKSNDKTFGKFTMPHCNIKCNKWEGNDDSDKICLLVII